MKLKVAILSSLFLIASLSTQAAVRVGVVDMSVLAAPDIQQLRSDLRANAPRNNAEIMKMQDSLRNTRNKLQNAPATMSQTDKDALAQQVNAEEEALRTKLQTLRDEMIKQRRDMMEMIRTKYRDAIKKVADEQKIDFVVPKQGVLYAQDQVDITVDVQKQSQPAA